MIYVSIILVIFTMIWFVLKLRNMDIWIFSYIRGLLARLFSEKSTMTHVYFCLADHYEPFHRNATTEVARNRVNKWVKNYPLVASRHSDSFGRAPQHTYFYPEEEYDEEIINKISVLCKDNLGDVEIHLHHDDDTEENLRNTLNRFKTLLHDKHDLLRKNSKGEIVYGFIHGNWALDNSRKDGKWCGIDNELDILIETGCAYDMTMPSAPSDTQTRIINKIYYAKEDGLCKSHDKGRELSVSTKKEKDEILMIQGPLTLNWRSRKFGIMPRIESGEISYDARSSLQRAKLWGDCGVSINGADDHIFIKLHCHGVTDKNLKMFYDENGLDKLWTDLESVYRDKSNYKLHYVTAWEMYEIINKLSSGK